jgi:hypothetical protein
MSSDGLPRESDQAWLARCPACGRNVPMMFDGRLQTHRRPGETGDAWLPECRGSLARVEGS